MTRRAQALAAGLAFAALINPAPAHSQVATLEPGTRIRLTTPPRTLPTVGTIDARTQDSMRATGIPRSTVPSTVVVVL